MRIFLIPPRNPHSTSARDRRWTIQVNKGNVIRFTELFGTNINDVKGAKAEANRVLNHKYTWLAKGRGYEARIPKEVRAS